MAEDLKAESFGSQNGRSSGDKPQAWLDPRFPMGDVINFFVSPSLGAFLFSFNFVLRSYGQPHSRLIFSFVIDPGETASFLIGSDGPGLGLTSSLE